MRICSLNTKLELIRSYFTNIYVGTFWYEATKKSFNKLLVSYNDNSRRLFGLVCNYSASEMLVFWDILTQAEIARKISWAFSVTMCLSVTFIIIMCLSVTFIVIVCLYVTFIVIMYLSVTLL